MTEFVPEAQALARRGVASLMIDAFWASRIGSKTGRSPATDYADSLRQVAQLRAAIDALAAHPNIDGARSGIRRATTSRDVRRRFFPGSTRASGFSSLSPGTGFRDVVSAREEAGRCRGVQNGRWRRLDPLSYLRVSHGADYLYPIRPQGPIHSD